MNPHVVRGQVTAPAQDIPTLTHSGCLQVYSRSNRIARTLRPADELQFNPVMMVRIDIAEENGNSVHVVENHADLSVIKNVTECGATSDRDHGEAGSLDSGHQLKFAVVQIVMEEHPLCVALAPFRMLIYFGVHVAIDDQQVFPSVVVVVKKTVRKLTKGTEG